MAKKEFVKSFEEACKAQGLNPEKVLPNVTNCPDQDKKAIIAHAKMCVIQRSLNGEWKADWRNHKQGKYYPWFDVVPNKGGPGVRLAYYDYDCDFSATGLGARFFFADSERAKYAGAQFIDLYEDMILMKGITSGMQMIL